MVGLHGVNKLGVKQVPLKAHSTQLGGLKVTRDCGENCSGLWCRAMAKRRGAGGFDDVLQFMRVLWALDHTMQERSKAMAARLGVTGLQRFVLRMVGHMPGITSAELSMLLHLHPSTLTGVLRRLERNRLLRRRKDRVDGRRGLLQLTEAGAKALAEHRYTVESVVRDALQHENPKQVATFIGFLRRLTAAFENAPAPATKF